MKSVSGLAFLFGCAIYLSGVNGQCSQSFSVTTSTQLNSISIFGSTTPPFTCLTYSYTYTAPPGSTLTLSCPSFYLSPTWFFPGWFGTPNPNNIVRAGSSFPTVTSTTNSLAVQWSSIRNTLPTWLSYFYLRFSFQCTIQASVPPPTSACDCGASIVADPVNRIVGGQPALESEVPYQARFVIFTTGGAELCGGSLISNQWVVTAAHCEPKINDQVILGDLSISGVSVNEQLRTIAQVILHPQYNTVTYINDIALVRLNTPVTFNDHVRAICLPDAFTANSFTGTGLKVTGWGTTSEGGAISDGLLKATVNAISNAACSAIPDSYYPPKVASSTICTLTAGRDSCQGDSGGPVAYRNGGKYYLIGVTSNGKGCARPNLPGISVRVSDPAILNWVKTNAAITCTAP